MVDLFRVFPQASRFSSLLHFSEKIFYCHLSQLLSPFIGFPIEGFNGSPKFFKKKFMPSKFIICYLFTAINSNSNKIFLSLNYCNKLLQNVFFYMCKAKMRNGFCSFLLIVNSKVCGVGTRAPQLVAILLGKRHFLYNIIFMASVGHQANH